MRTVAVILAGGVGKRLGASCPKQFLEIRGKPVIVHTVENFQRNPSVDAVVIVCVPDWTDHMAKLVDEYKLTKVEAIVPGGETSHDSTRNGIFRLRNELGKGDFVIIHDAARPILPQAAIDEMLRVAREKGNASLAIPCYETVIYTDDQKSGDKELDRNRLMRVQTPQAYEYSDLLSLYDRAEAEGKHDFIYADLVEIYYGRRVYFSKGFANNIKITKPEDIPLCESLMSFSEDQLFNL
ncbi:2-C-methyl-D-erythritol 4-phosphate cytidylyltransferase [Candidatus Methanomethylophilus sp. 1R26]|uniref:IspD/TarI family cytidylyltransferase n=1 Tax=Candidatus Methanomethylophilus sp. 1R26 TaxID=1769296 RepID=UPI000736665E|nr:IspD/TarI family cytidylyltransferase [Candidatus Methanomethylophilus sp. 1R26]KUE73136.1 2-C-methyl-D-erythritol 4-phosphate cytidylyltransferase [Candidatus Methanomethylophilus sp. 1R26]